MTLAEAMKELEALGTEAMRAYNRKGGVDDNQFGLKMGDIRVVAKKAKSDHALALQLWKTENLDARFLATLVIKPKELSTEELDAMVRSVKYAHLADWLNSYVVKQHPEKEAMRERWMADADPMASRAGWSLTTERVGKSPEGLDLKGLLDRIDAEMGTAPEAARWTMNFCLIEIGVKFPEYRERAIAIGETHGAYRDYPTSKGCISPFAPIAITELAKREA